MINVPRLLLLTFVVLSLVISSNARITLNNNGYEGIQIVISNAVPEDPYLITRIQEIFTNASRYLFTATRNRAFFRQIDVIVPKTWTNVTYNSTVASIDTSTEYIFVDKAECSYGNNPYTRGNLECGKPAWYIHLTPDFLTDSNGEFGNEDKVIVHEWGHLRWGLFDEYASLLNKRVEGDKPYIHFYPNNGQNRPVACSRSVTGVAYKDGEVQTDSCDLKQLPMDPECKFRPDFNQETRASIMGHQWIHSIVDFCDVDVEENADDLRHNKEAQNMQNRLCNQQSAWEVMLQHEDFTNGNNPSNTSITDITPEFRVFRKSEKIRVLVFDVSGSMSNTGSTGARKVLEQANAAYFVIDNIIEIGSYLAMVQFHSEARILVNLRAVTDEQTKDKIKALVPRAGAGGTDIYEGLTEAIGILDQSQSPTTGTEIILLSDGESNPYLRILPDIISRGIKVHTIAITDSADAAMTSLSTQTGGKSFTYLQTKQISFADVLTQSLQDQDEGEITPQQIFGTVYQVSQNSTQITGSFVIDEGLGNYTSVTVLLSSNQSVTLDVIGPDGSVYSLNEQGESVKLLVSENTQATVGRFNFTINFPSAFSGTAEIRVQSSATSDDDSEVIQVKTRLSSNKITYDTYVRIFVSVEKCEIPILNANVTLVLASDSSFTPKVLLLSDSGAGADPFADDGIYSAYLLHTYFTVNSYYNVKVYVRGDENTFYYKTNTAKSRASTVSGNDEGSSTIELVGVFERQTVAEGITVENFQYNATNTIPPAQITDLRYVTIVGSESTMAYTFAWTAVGSDLDIGQASAYEMRFDANIDNLRYNFSESPEVNTTLLQPQPSGSDEMLKVIFTLSDCSGTCFVAIRARDDNNLNGSISNIISIDIDFSYTFTEAIVTEDESETSNLLLIIILVTVAIVLILGLFIVAFRFKHHTGKYETHIKKESPEIHAPQPKDVVLQEIRVTRDTPDHGISGPYVHLSALRK